MKWLEPLLNSLAAQPVCGYAPDREPATEPTALAALALFAAGRAEPALRAADWLAELQTDEGSVGVTRSATTPRWPTSLAILSWHMAQQHRPDYQATIDAAVRWTCRMEGNPLEPTPDLGHDVTLVAWPWVEGTHSWLEPTSLHVVALKATGQREHARTREAVRMLLDRQLPDGGCNYGNTTVLGNTLRPHVQPTGACLLALAGETLGYGRIARAVGYLNRNLGPETTASSLAWGLLGLAAHGKYPDQAHEWLRAAFRRGLRWSESPHRRALLALAAFGPTAPFVTLVKS